MADERARRLIVSHYPRALAFPVSVIGKDFEYPAPKFRSCSRMWSCKLAAFPLEHIANDHPRSFRGEQAGFGCALPAGTPTNEYDLAFESSHFDLDLAFRPITEETAAVRISQPLRCNAGSHGGSMSMCWV